MRALSIVCLGLLPTLVLKAQLPPSVVWQSTRGGSQPDYSEEVQQTMGSGLYFVEGSRDGQVFVARYLKN